MIVEEEYFCSKPVNMPDTTQRFCFNYKFLAKYFYFTKFKCWLKADNAASRTSSPNSSTENAQGSFVSTSPILLLSNKV